MDLKIIEAGVGPSFLELSGKGVLMYKSMWGRFAAQKVVMIFMAEQYSVTAPAAYQFIIYRKLSASHIP